MWTFNCFFVFLTILQGVFLQGMRPPPCGPPPQDKPFECCKIPQLFNEEDRKECGVDIAESREQASRPDCSKLVCLFKKNKLMKDDNTVDKEAFAAFADKWGEENSDFKDAVELVKKNCLKDDGPKGAMFCEPGKIVGCSFFVTFDNCPNWEKSDKCNDVKEYMQKCKEKFENA
ncbi:uncharacterized protein LOC119834009 [Zerene cesonia]|uniref:uncharacterized protein LOC119834009 n=1 Tax=Zerene cesonia TaxID=33412 RepID=UPI0018E52694|nr:uncharacterized protein LOC119834009 [Zerene cesonia]